MWREWYAHWVFMVLQNQGSLGQFKEGTSTLNLLAVIRLRQGDEELVFGRPKLTLAYSLTSSFQIRLEVNITAYFALGIPVFERTVWNGPLTFRLSLGYENWVVFSSVNQG